MDLLIVVPVHTLAQVTPDMIHGDSQAQALGRRSSAKPGAQIPNEPGSCSFTQTAFYVCFFGFVLNFII